MEKDRTVVKLKIWTKREGGFLKRYYRKMNSEELAKKFGVSPEAIRKKEKELGLIREHPRRRKEKRVAPSVSRKWTKKEELYIQEHYLKETNAELAKRFKVTPKSVEKKLWRMGLKRRRKGHPVSGEGRKTSVERFLQEGYRAKEEKKIDEQRFLVIEEFEAAIQLYYARKYKQAEGAFGRIVKDFAGVHDLVYKARQYIKFCLNKI